MLIVIYSKSIYLRRMLYGSLRGRRKPGNSIKDPGIARTSVSVWKGLTRTWPLPGRDSPEKEQIEIPNLIWKLLAETVPIEMHLLYNLEVIFI